MSELLVYVTAGSREAALDIAHAVVSERLAASANVLPGVVSVYWWEGAMQEAGEAVLVLKTVRDRLDALVARIRALHSYTCPCVVALPVVDGNPDYLAWIAAETHAPPRDR